MAYLLFIDESGHDHGAAPYEVLAGVAVEDRELWQLILALRDAEVWAFGRRVTQGSLELKGKALLKRKTFRLADQMPAFDEDERRTLASACIEKSQAGLAVTRPELTALGQAKLAFCERLLETCNLHHVRAFASIIDPSAARPAGDFLRKDYAYLFERFFYFLDARPDQPQGVVVFDELEKSRCHLLIDQMGHYFHQTATGRWRASRVIPEPFFVHSDLTSLIQVADLVAYIISWGVRFGDLDRPARSELARLGQMVCRLRHRATRERDGEPFYVWSFAAIHDLRPRDEREGDG